MYFVIFLNTHYIISLVGKVVPSLLRLLRRKARTRVLAIFDPLSPSGKDPKILGCKMLIASSVKLLHNAVRGALPPRSLDVALSALSKKDA